MYITPKLTCMTCDAQTAWAFQTKSVYPSASATFILSTAFRRVPKCPYVNFGKLVCRRVGVSAVVKVRGSGGFSPLLPFEHPCNSMSPLIESIKCYYMPK